MIMLCYILCWEMGLALGLTVLGMGTGLGIGPHCVRDGHWVRHGVRFHLGNHSNMPNQTDYHALKEWDPGMAPSCVTTGRFMCLHTNLHIYSSLPSTMICFTLIY